MEVVACLVSGSSVIAAELDSNSIGVNSFFCPTVVLVSDGSSIRGSSPDVRRFGGTDDNINGVDADTSGLVFSIDSNVLWWCWRR